MISYDQPKLEAVNEGPDAWGHPQGDRRIQDWVTSTPPAHNRAPDYGHGPTDPWGRGQGRDRAHSGNTTPTSSGEPPYDHSAYGGRAQSRRTSISTEMDLGMAGNPAALAAIESIMQQSRLAIENIARSQGVMGGHSPYGSNLGRNGPSGSTVTVNSSSSSPMGSSQQTPPFQPQRQDGMMHYHQQQHQQEQHQPYQNQFAQQQYGQPGVGYIPNGLQTSSRPEEHSRLPKPLDGSHGDKSYGSHETSSVNGSYFGGNNGSYLARTDSSSSKSIPSVARVPGMDMYSNSSQTTSSGRSRSDVSIPQHPQQNYPTYPGTPVPNMEDLPDSGSFYSGRSTPLAGKAGPAMRRSNDTVNNVSQAARNLGQAQDSYQNSPRPSRSESLSSNGQQPGQQQHYQQQEQVQPQSQREQIQQHQQPPIQRQQSFPNPLARQQSPPVLTPTNDYRPRPGLEPDYFINDKGPGASSSSSSSVPSAVSPLAGRNLNVLVVEDNSMCQKIVSQMLRKHHCSITVAGDGVEAVHMWREREREGYGDRAAKGSGGFDVILMDIRMPNMDGITCTHVLRAGGCRVPIVAVTAERGEAERFRCMKAGMVSCVHVFSGGEIQYKL